MKNLAIGVVYCRNDHANFKACPDHHSLRVVGNISPKFPNEKLYLKTCKLINHDLGTCEHQFLHGRLPAIPKFFCHDEK